MVASDQCLRCETSMESIGVRQFRTGGTSGGWKLLAGEFAELGEEMLPLAVLVCTNCGYTELRYPPVMNEA